MMLKVSNSCHYSGVFLMSAVLLVLRNFDNIITNYSLFILYKRTNYRLNSLLYMRLYYINDKNCGGTKKKHPGSPPTLDRWRVKAMLHSQQTTQVLKNYLPEDRVGQVRLGRSSSTR